MKTEKRTAEEILDKHIAIKLEAIPDIVPAMHEFAAQELAEYKTVIKELIPIAENAPTDYINFGKTKQEAIIERARKLIKL